jgi:tripartite-type tricarboxylate transporter receptor subunit TctC
MQRALLGALILVGLAGAVQAQSFPSKAARIIVAFPPGGATDIVARIYAAKLTEMWSQQVIVDNRAGAAGVIGTEIAARAPADGYTMLLGTLGNLVVNPLLYRKLSFDVARDFAPVQKVVDVYFVMVSHPSLPARTVKELLALARAKPGQINYGSSGNGSTNQLAVELFKMLGKVDLLHIPYKGSGPLFADLLGGHISLTTDSIVQALPYIRENRLRALGVAGRQRSALLPDIPTIAEAGVPGYEITNWFSLMVPAATPKDIVARIHADITKIAQNPEVRQKVSGMGADPVVQTPEDLAAMLRSETAKWEKVVREAGIKAD